MTNIIARHMEEFERWKEKKSKEGDGERDPENKM